MPKDRRLVGIPLKQLGPNLVPGLDRDVLRPDRVRVEPEALLDQRPSARREVKLSPQVAPDERPPPPADATDDPAAAAPTPDAAPRPREPEPAVRTPAGQERPPAQREPLLGGEEAPQYVHRH